MQDSSNTKVRLGQVLENSEVETKRLGKHQGRVHNLAVEPGSPYIFYSCGEDGFIQHIMESNRQAREDHSRITVTPDVIMRVLQLHRRQALTYIQRRYNTADVEGDEEDEFITAFSGDVSSEDGNSRECSIS